MQCNMVRRFIGMVVFVVMLMSFAVIPGVAESSGTTFSPGEYTAKGAGHNGDIEVAVVFEVDRIAEIKLLNHAETLGIADASLSGTPQAILDAQSTQAWPASRPRSRRGRAAPASSCWKRPRCSAAPARFRVAVSAQSAPACRLSTALRTVPSPGKNCG